MIDQGGGAGRPPHVVGELALIVETASPGTPVGTPAATQAIYSAKLAR
jgi:hypothetical protein